MVSIIIVSFNAKADLERCIGSLQASPPQTPYEIIVVDNQSTDGSAEAARRAQVRVIDSDRNVGFAAANNIGIRASAGDLLLLLNGDTIVPAGAVDALVRELVSDPSAAVAGPRLVDGNGRAELSFGRMISPLNEWRQKRLQRDAERVEGLTRQRAYPDWVSGACLLVRRTDAEAVGLLDERFFMYTEDVDFCASIRARGRRILFTPVAGVVHVRGRSAASAPAATNRAYQRSRLAFYRKHHPIWAPLLRLYVSLRSLTEV